jgi:nucleotide-binding universal stress UspA family protein
VSSVLAQAELIRSFEPENVYLLNVASGNCPCWGRKIDKIDQGMRDLGLPVQRMVRYGHVPSQIVGTAERTDSVICFVRKRKNPLKKALTGSVISDTVRLSNEPVLIFKKAIFERPSNELQTSMYATDFQHSDQMCIKYIRHYSFNAKRLILLHVGQRAPDPETEKERLKNVHANLSRLALECQDNFEEIEKREVVGLRAEQKILRQTKKDNVDLLVIGKIDKNGIMSRLTGSTAEAIYNHSLCSVLIIPNKR